MKKKDSKLQLHKETLRDLKQPQLKEAAAGASDTCYSIYTQDWGHTCRVL